MFTAHDVCSFLGTSKSTLFRWEHEGRIPTANRDPEGKRVYTFQDIENIIKMLSSKQKAKAKRSLLRKIQSQEEHLEDLRKQIEPIIEKL